MVYHCRVLREQLKVWSISVLLIPSRIHHFTLVDRT